MATREAEAAVARVLIASPVVKTHKLSVYVNACYTTAFHSRAHDSLDLHKAVELADCYLNLLEHAYRLSS